MDHCAKCLCQVGADAVVLKNGSSLCPACYQRLYPAQKEPEKPKRISISVEGVIAIVAVIGLFGIGYKVFQHVSETNKAEMRAAKDALEAAEKRRLEDKAEQEAYAQKMEAQRVAAADKLQADRDARIAAQKIAEKDLAVARENKRLADLHNKEQFKLEEERKLAAAAEKARFEEADRRAKDDAENSKTRSGEIAVLTRTVLESQKVLQASQTAQAEMIRKAAASKTILRVASDTKAALVKQYKHEFNVGDSRDVMDIPKWRNASATTTHSSGGGSAVTIEAPNYSGNIKKFDNAVRDIQASEDILAQIAADQAKVETAIAESKVKIETANRRLLELNVTAAEIGAAPSVAPLTVKAGFKIISLKNGTQIRAKGIIKTGDEVNYRDEEGKAQTLKNDDVDKIE